MRIPPRRTLLRQACLEESFVGGATRSCLGALGFHGSPSTYLVFFALCTYIRFSSSTGRWRYRWDMLDNKFVERDDTRRHGGMYSLAFFFWKSPFWHCCRLWYTKSFKWIIIEQPRNIVCLMGFYLKYGPVFLHFRSPHLINPKILRSFLIVQPQLGQRNETILIFFQLLVHGLVK